MIAENITWGQFAGAVSLSAAAYYLYLVVSGKIRLFNPTASSGAKEGSPVSQGKKRIWQPQDVPAEQVAAGSYAGNPAGQEPSQDMEQEEEDNSFQLLETLAIEVQEIISGQGEMGTKEELLEALSVQIVTYPTLNQPAFRAAISNIIIKAAKSDCLIDITRAEAEALFGQP
ncbi:hypothetical protein PV783_13855 [Chitinophaga sp. CC14]|uniref:hypothetical protein n=1 Tax=Chitinophaga sp. CC14 TaxID=3029199 RepID=UPI003B76C54D